MSGPSLNLKALASHVGLYRDLWARHGFDPRAGGADFSSIPLVGKDDFRRAGVAGRIDTRFSMDDVSRERSGGSSGEPVEIVIDKLSRRRRQ